MASECHVSALPGRPGCPGGGAAGQLLQAVTTTGYEPETTGGLGPGAVTHTHCSVVSDAGRCTRSAVLFTIP